MRSKRLKSIRDAALIRPLFRVWEPAQETKILLNSQEAITELTNE